MIRNLSMLSSLAVAIVEAKYPKEFCDSRYARTVFETIELVGDELVKKNCAIFVDPFINELVDIKDVTYGEADRMWFAVSPEGVQRIPNNM